MASGFIIDARKGFVEQDEARGEVRVRALVVAARSGEERDGQAQGSLSGPDNGRNAPSCQRLTRKRCQAR
jgi:hypothetical protein